jgi:CelD/BcsL family acetyltransferase involved in cellulose biosynthesis
VAFRKYAGDTDLRAEMEALFILHKQRWRQKGFTSKFTSTVEQDFYYDVSKLFCQNGWLNLSFLDVDGKPVSAVWGFDYADTYYEMTSSFDTDYAEYSIGTIHLWRLLEDCIQNGRTKFSFLKGDESYKFRWAHHTVNNVQITMTKRGIAERSRIMLLDVLPKIGLFRPVSIWRRTIRYLKIHKKGK